MLKKSTPSKKRYKICTLLLTAVFCFHFLAGCKNQEPASQEPPSRESADIAMIKDYFPVEDYSYVREEEVTHVMLHFTSAVVSNREDPYDMKENRQIFLDGEVSTHYIIDRDGTLYQWIPENRAAWHAGKGKWQKAEHTNRMNHYAIGIEMLGMGTEEEMSLYLTSDEYANIAEEHIGFTSAQYKTLNTLIDDICNFYPNVKKDRDHIIGHDQYSDNKNDPGKLFQWGKLGL